MKIYYKLLTFLLIASLLITESKAEIKIENIVSNNNDGSIGDNNQDNSGFNSNPTNTSVNNDSSNSAGNSSLAENSNNNNQSSSNLIISDVYANQNIPSLDAKLANKKPLNNNIGISFNIGKKIYLSALNSDNISYQNFILTEVFAVKNFLESKYGNINSISGFRFGFGRSFNKFNLVFSANYGRLNFSSSGVDIKFDGVKEYLLNYGLTYGIPITKLIEFRVNFISTLYQKIAISSQSKKISYNNFDFGLAYNF